MLVNVSFYYKKNIQQIVSSRYFSIDETDKFNRELFNEKKSLISLTSSKNS